jgi:hypothetical protein
LCKTTSLFKDHQVISAPEHAFSSGQLTGTYLCNQLKTDTYKALQIVKSNFCNGALSASNEAANHVAANWDFGELVNREDDVDPI